LHVPYQMGEVIDARGGKLDRVLVIEHVSRDLESEPVAFVDDDAGQRDRQAGRATAAVVDPDLDGIDLSGRKLQHRVAGLILGGDLIGDARIGRRARAGVRRPDAASGQHEPRAADASGSLVGADLVHDVALLDALRHHGGNAEVKRAVEIVENGLAGEILHRIAQPPLEAWMHMGADDRWHDGFAVEVDPHRACRRRDFALAADAGNGAAFYEQGAAFNSWSAIAGDYARAFEQDRLGEREFRR